MPRLRKSRKLWKNCKLDDDFNNNHFMQDKPVFGQATTVEG